MKNNKVRELLVSCALIAVLLLFLNPLHAWMSNVFVAPLLILLVITFAIFGSFGWRESVRDEREVAHRMLAGRIAYLAGAIMLVLGIIVQTIRGAFDPWLVVTLSVMIVAKILGVVYGSFRR